jgi:RNA polymerase sigma factor (sigma-70 family)
MAVALNIKTTNNYFERTDTLVKYYHDAVSYDVIDAEHEKELFTLLKIGKENLEKAKKNGDTTLMHKYEREVNKLREFIVNSNLRFVISIARIYASNKNLLDLIDEGNIGLIKAVDSFNVELGNRFQTHAVYLIRRQINLFRQGDDKIVKKNNETKTFHIISKMTNKFMQEYQREPTSEELKDFINLNYPNANIQDSTDVLTIKVASIDEPVDSEDGDANIGNINTFNTYSASYNDYEGKSNLDHIKAFVENIMKGLSDRDKEIVKMHFGIDQPYNAPIPVSEISFKLGLTPERVRQIIGDAKKKMKSEYSGKLHFL